MNITRVRKLTAERPPRNRRGMAYTPNRVSYSLYLIYSAVLITLSGVETQLSVWLPIPGLYFVCLGLLRLCLSEALLWQLRIIIFVFIAKKAYRRHLDGKWNPLGADGRPAGWEMRGDVCRQRRWAFSSARRRCRSRRMARRLTLRQLGSGLRIFY